MVTLIALIISIIGSLVWMILGIFSFNLVTWIFGLGVLTRIVYVIVGLAGIWLLIMLIAKRGKISTI